MWCRRVERLAETKTLNQFRQKFAERFAQYMPEQLKTDSDAFVRFEIPYVPLYAFEEIVQVNRSATLERAVEMEQAYSALLEVLRKLPP